MNRIVLSFFLMLLACRVFGATSLPPVGELSPYWREYFRSVDEAVEENFWGSLSILRKTEGYGDPYIPHLKAMGYCLEGPNPHPASFHEAISWVFAQVQGLIDSGTLNERDVLWPAKAFSTQTADGSPRFHFVPFGAPIPTGAQPLNLLKPDIFVEMLSEGFFSIGEGVREHTNQTLCEHDLAHMSGFISSPRYMKSVREAFRRISIKMKKNPRVAAALKEFDSLYSLRLYYMIEIFTEIPESRMVDLQRLIELPLDDPPTREVISAFLRKKAERPADLYRYLATLYEEFHRLVNPLGGESRDMLNRRRKFHRGTTLGSFYDGVSTQTSKFDQSSIYAMFLNAKAALENKRSNHPDFDRAIDEIHTPLIGALIGTSQLNVEEWVLQAIEEVPDPESKLYRYLHDSHLWNHKQILYIAYTDPQYDRVLR